jgi:hypothetical protein
MKLDSYVVGEHAPEDLHEDRRAYGAEPLAIVV